MENIQYLSGGVNSFDDLIELLLFQERLMHDAMNILI